MIRHRSGSVLSNSLVIGLVVAAALTMSTAGAAAQRVSEEPRSWSVPYVALAGAFTVALWIDAAQTREALRRGYAEANPVLGPHPSEGQVNTYTALAGLTVLGATAAAPARLRPWLLGAALAVETYAIAGNVRAGIALRFP